MTFTKEKAKENLSRLIAKFERELAAGKISEYNEEAAKIAFIQPLLKDVLGWDVNDHNEVGPEERTSRGRVDYGLKVEGKIKIFVEAKPPKVDLDRHIEQAIRYGYNRKGVPFVLLTDFEALKLFDVTVKPDIRNPHKKLQAAKGSEKDNIQRQIEKTDREIDDLVYKLYGITEEERRIIETEIQRQEH